MIAAGLAAALADVAVAPDRCSAVVHGDPIDADEPRTLRATLAVALYERLHVGRPHVTDGDDVANRPRTMREPAFEEALAAAVPHDCATVTGTVVAEARGGALVQLPDARVWVPSAALGSPACRGERVEVSVPAARAALSPGFFLVQSAHRRDPGGIGRVYVHVPGSDDAACVWRVVLRALDELGDPYRCKIASSVRAYPRRDAIVCYVARPRAVAGLLAERLRGHAGLGTSTSAFAEAVAPGIAIADEPADPRPGRRGLSFGEHRCRVVAEALVEHAAGDRAEDRIALVAAALRAGGADPMRPARNLARAR